MRAVPKYVFAAGLATVVLATGIAIGASLGDHLFGGDGTPKAGETEAGDRGSRPAATKDRGKVENLNADLVDSTDVSPILVRMAPGTSTPHSLSGPSSLSVNARCGADGHISVTATTHEPGIIHGYAHGVAEGRDWEGWDDSFVPGELFTTGFHQSHAGTLRYVDDDEAVTVDLSTEEPGGARPSCLVFGTAFAGPHAVGASIAGGS
jgi:hypothetical protein